MSNGSQEESGLILGWQHEIAWVKQSEWLCQLICFGLVLCDFCARCREGLCFSRRKICDEKEIVYDTVFEERKVLASCACGNFGAVCW